MRNQLWAVIALLALILAWSVWSYLDMRGVVT